MNDRGSSPQGEGYRIPLIAYFSLVFHLLSGIFIAGCGSAHSVTSA